MNDIPRTVLDRAMRNVLAQLELVSNGTITSYNASGGGVSEKTDPRPRGGDAAPHLYWARRYGSPFAVPTDKTPGAHNDAERHEILQAARAEWKKLTGRGLALVERPAGETRGERDARIVKDGEGWSVRDAANHFKCGDRDVTAARRAAGRELAFGKAPEVIQIVDDRAERARSYRTQGLSYRSIALLLGVGKDTIKRDLCKEAA